MAQTALFKAFQEQCFSIESAWRLIKT